jgi:alanine racemase
MIPMSDKNYGAFEGSILRPSWIEVDLDALAHNVRQIKMYLGKPALAAILKGDAFGLGSVPVSRVVIENGADRLGVVMLDEAVELRQAGIIAPILNMGPIMPEQAHFVIDYNLEQMVFQMDVAQALSNAAMEKGAAAKVHFKIDTGMSRYGVPYQDAVEMFSQMALLPNLQFVGAMTHFPMSDELDKSFALLQIRRFKEIRQALKQRGHHIPLWHICNSGGTLDLPEAHMDMVRVGIMLYGYFPSDKVRRPFALKPAMSVKTRIVTTRTIGRGDTVGYGRRFMAEKEERIAVLPIGYVDGYDRGLRNIGQVLLQGRKAPIIGGICMDACFIKITDFPGAQVGDVVTIMGKDGAEEISPHDIADLIGSVSYEVLSRFGKRLPRVYLKDGEVVEVKNWLVGKQSANDSKTVTR